MYGFFAKLSLPRNSSIVYDPLCGLCFDGDDNIVYVLIPGCDFTPQISFQPAKKKIKTTQWESYKLTSPNQIEIQYQLYCHTGILFLFSKQSIHRIHKVICLTSINICIFRCDGYDIIIYFVHV